MCYRYTTSQYHGASGQSRTGDTGIFSPLLYLLSYRGIVLVHPVRLELTSPFGHQILSLARIPIPPRMQINLVRKVGFEPTRHRWRRLLRPPCLPISSLAHMVCVEGIEPSILAATDFKSVVYASSTTRRYLVGRGGVSHTRALAFRTALST